MTYPYTPAQLEDDRKYRERADHSEKERPRLRHPGEGVEDYRLALGWDKPSPVPENDDVAEMMATKAALQDALYKAAKALTDFMGCGAVMLAARDGHSVLVGDPEAFPRLLGLAPGEE